MTNIPLIAFATIAVVSVLLLTHRVLTTMVHCYKVRARHAHRHHFIEAGRERVTAWL